MKCPKCDEGTLETITFRKVAKKAQLCSFCGAVWFAGERILVTTGHTIGSVAEEEGFDEQDEQDQDHRPISSVRVL